MGLVGATISLDHWEPHRHNAVRKNPRAFELAVSAVRLLRAAGVFPVIGVVLSRELLANRGLYRFLSFAGEVGAGMIQVLDPMPAGVGSGDDAGAAFEEICGLVERLEGDPAPEEVVERLLAWLDAGYLDPDAFPLTLAAHLGLIRFGAV